MNALPRRSLLRPADWGWMLGLMTLGMGLRLLYFSGVGLGDDPIFLGELSSILNRHRIIPDNQSYRFAWWFPTALSCRLFGFSEWSLILPYTVTSTLGIGLLYVFGKLLWGRPGAVIAGLLLLFAPLDFAWSTMMTNDLMLSFYSALTILLVLRALEEEDVGWRRRLWTLGAISFWLAFHSKMSALLLGPAIAFICLSRLRRLNLDVLYFAFTFGLLLGGDLLLDYVLKGDVLFMYHAELAMQGITPEEAAKHRFTWSVFWAFPRMLFAPDHLGDLLYSVYPHLLLGLALLSPLLGIRSSGAVFWWLFFVFLGMQFNLQRMEGYWTAVFRNYRHAHVFLYPIILLLTGYLVMLRAKRPRLVEAALGALLIFSAWQSVSTASKTKVAFADRRNVCRFLVTLPPKPIHTDMPIRLSCQWLLGPEKPELEMNDLPPGPQQRRAQIAAISAGYLVTGGAREPHYGRARFLPSADDLPPGRWRLVRELSSDAPIAPWRTEPLRVWEAIEPPPDAPPRAPTS